MVATSAAAAARTDQQWTCIVRIEGLGDYTGSYSWCTTVPQYLAGTAQAFGDLMSWPELLSERVKPIGGVPEPGSCQVELLDFRGQDGVDILTAALRIERAAATKLTAAITASSSSIAFADETLIPATGVVWIGNEALRVTGGGPGLSRNVTRGWLGTDPQAHALDSRIYVSCPYLLSRRVSVYLAPIDGDSSATELLVGQYRIDTPDLGSQLCSYVLGGATQLRYLGRDVASHVAVDMRIAAAYTGGPNMHWVPARGGGGGELLNQVINWPDNQLFLMVGDRDDAEIVRAEVNGTTLQRPQITARAQCGTRQREIKPGDPVKLVCTADPDYGFFRHSPGPTPSSNRFSGVWNITQNWVDHLLIALTSSAHPDDGLELLNYVAAYGNFSSLPRGFGVGYPAALIDFASFDRVRARTRDYAFPNAIIGDQRMSFADWASSNYLEPVGAFLANVTGQLQLILPRIPMVGESATALGVNDILSIERCGFHTDSLAGAVTYKLPGPNGEENELTFRSSDFQATFGQRGLYSYDERGIEIPLRSMRSDEAGLSALLVKLAMRRLVRFSRPMLELRLILGSHLIASGDVGTLFAVTHPEIPNFSTGVRGVTSAIFQVVERQPIHHDEYGPCLMVTMLGYGQQRAARIAPAASVFSSSANGGNRDVVTVANRYTSSDGALLSLPATDAAAFAVNDVVQERTRAGVDVGSPRTVVAVGTNLLTLSGSGIPSPGNVITFAAYASAIAQQRASYVFFASEDTGVISAGVDPWTYGEA